MKAVLYYFTGTGNTLAIARDLARELGGADIVPVVKALSAPVSGSYDTVGIVCPVYMFGIPLIVARFLRSIEIPKDAYLFSVVNYGGMQGRANQQIAELMKRRGHPLAAGFGLKMPGNYTPLYGAIQPDEQKAMFDAGKAHIKEIAAAVRARSGAILENASGLLGLLIYILCYHAGSRMVPAEDRNFWITDACTHCGLCAKVCPVDNIVMQDGHPAWLHHCQTCMACLQWCPVSAIQFGKSTKGRMRYHHPECSARDIEAQKK